MPSAAATAETRSHPLAYISSTTQWHSNYIVLVLAVEFHLFLTNIIRSIIPNFKSQFFCDNHTSVLAANENWSKSGLCSLHQIFFIFLVNDLIRGNHIDLQRLGLNNTNISCLPFSLHPLPSLYIFLLCSPEKKTSLLYLFYFCLPLSFFLFSGFSRFLVCCLVCDCRLVWSLKGIRGGFGQEIHPCVFPLPNPHTHRVELSGFGREKNNDNCMTNSSSHIWHTPGLELNNKIRETREIERETRQFRIFFLVWSLYMRGGSCGSQQ
ncbi:uncharacterized protein VP01_805g1 [Puccinia sorghi]|uniref:Uncharacterized protein n=1 Tax=Puccinia sorghi TaxID=27349 RepID=A0A0L6UAC1_9BASI|nr:uncharacterized protein VP01_805g1 [Puccinia sorghi]